MARDPGNKPAWRIGIAGIGVLIVAIAILALFAVRMARAPSHPAGQAPSTAR